MQNDFTWKRIILIIFTIGLALCLILLYRYSLFQDKEREKKLEILVQHEKNRQLLLAQERQQEELEREIKSANCSFYQKLSDGFDVNILVLGDSIGEGAGASDKNHQWGNLLRDRLRSSYDGNVLVTNVSIGASTSYTGYFRTMMLNDGIDYDLVIICYGQNDSLENFGLYYEAMIRAAKKNYPKAAIISILESSQLEYTEKMMVIQNIASHYDIAIADTIAPFSKNYKSYVSDNDVIHPNDGGQAVYADTIMTVINRLVNENHGFDNENVSVIDERAMALDSFTWYGVEEFEREDNSYILRKAFSGVVLGVDYYLFNGSNKFKVLIDGVEYSNPQREYIYETKKHHIMVINDWIHGDRVDVKHEIKIVFPEDEIGKLQADNFKGIAVSGY